MDADIAMVQEIHMIGNGEMDLLGDRYKMFFSGHHNTKREGVAIVVRKNMDVGAVKCISLRLMAMTI
ncbi:MAG: hypothetical protein ACK56C_01525, partial [Alphaproteobacteria bacterium]